MFCTTSSLSYGSSKGVVDFYQGVVAGPKNGGVNFAARRFRREHVHVLIIDVSQRFFV